MTGNQPNIYELAGLYGLEIAYDDVIHHRKQTASIEALLAILKSLGAPIAKIEDVPSAWRAKQQGIWQQSLEPVNAVLENRPTTISLRLPASISDRNLTYRIKMESGEEISGGWSEGDGAISQAAEVEGARYVIKQVPLLALPAGYHTIDVEFPGKTGQSLIISAPEKAYSGVERLWGAFLPLYALRTGQNWGSGDFSDLETLIGWVEGLGGKIAATLPLLATFFNIDTDISPYMPVSRRMWNEYYIDVMKIPELAECSQAQELISSSEFQDTKKTLRLDLMVDYRRTMALKRRVLEELSRNLFSKQSGRLSGLRKFTEEHPIVEDYARFRAACEKQKGTWQRWPRQMKNGILKEGDYDEDIRRYHIYVQWIASQQLRDISQKAAEKGLHLYFDFPLGTHPDGYDAWRETDAFIQDVRAGAPPDTVFTSGQNWAFFPPHPEKIREQGYRYFIACLRHNMEYAGMLRIDHMMGFHRLFCIPAGMGSDQGVYLHYTAEELYAVLTLESQRKKTSIVGEDLGMVPYYVRPAMQRHGLKRLYVLRYELAGDIQGGLHPVPPDAVASLNTHDMPPFAGFWQGLDISERERMNLLDKDGALKETKNLPGVREVLLTFLRNGGWLQGDDKDILAILKACLLCLAASEADTLLINLEDLWLETRPQNMPGTSTQYSNWRRKAAYSFEEFCQMPQVIDILNSVSRLRQSERAH